MSKDTLNRANMVQHLKDEMGFSRREARAIVDGFFAQISTALIEGKQVSLAGLGKFLPVQRMARPGRNPRTGAYHDVPPRRTAVFRTGSRLKRRLAGKP